jgi:hypothetical protein
MTRFIDALAAAVARMAMAICALAHRVPRRTGAGPAEAAPEPPPQIPMVRHGLPPVE